MTFRFKLAAWFSLSFLVLVGVLLFTAHRHLDEELREDRWDRSHPKFPGWVIHGSYTDEEAHDILGELLRVWLWVGVPMVVASLAAGYFMAWRSLHPVKRINRELAALLMPNLGHGISLPERDAELAALVGHLNNLLSRVALSYRELSDFSSRVAHELRMPLAILRMRIEAAAGDLPPDFSEDMQEEIGRLARLVDRSLLAAKAEGGRLEVRIENVHLSALLEAMREDYHLAAGQEGIELVWRVEPGLICSADAEIVCQIFHNLLGNAVRYGRAKIRVKAAARGKGSGAAVSITNWVGQPDSSRQGVGIGLRLVRALAGALSGARFRVRQMGGIYSARLVLP